MPTPVKQDTSQWKPVNTDINSQWTPINPNGDPIYPEYKPLQPPVSNPGKMVSLLKGATEGIGTTFNGLGDIATLGLTHLLPDKQLLGPQGSNWLEPNKDNSWEQGGKFGEQLAEWLIPVGLGEKLADEAVIHVPQAARWLKPTTKILGSALEGAGRSQVQGDNPLYGAVGMGAGSGISELGKLPINTGGLFPTTVQQASKKLLKNITPVIGAGLGVYENRQSPMDMLKGAAYGAFGGKMLDKILPASIPTIFKYAEPISRVLTGAGQVMGNLMSPHN